MDKEGGGGGGGIVCDSPAETSKYSCFGRAKKSRKQRLHRQKLGRFLGNMRGITNITLTLGRC